MDAADSISAVHPSSSPPREIPSVHPSSSPPLDIPAVDDSPAVEDPPPSDEEDDHQTSSASDLRAKIIKQVEYYFSDENLPTDKFLMKQVKKDKEGFVSISLIASFRKMKKITKDFWFIIEALKESSQLVVSSDGKKVKRLLPLPLIENKDTMLCTVVVANLPEDRSVENIQKIFGEVGSIKSISIHDSLSAEDPVSKKAKKLVNGKIFALVEYETVEAAETAVAILNDETDWRNGLRVQHLQNQKVGRKACRGSDPEKGHARQPVSVKDEDNNHSIEQQDVDDEVGEYKTGERNGRKGRNRSKGRKYRVNNINNGMGHGTTSTVNPLKSPPGPRMPDGTRGFTMGRGRPLMPEPDHS